MIAWHGHRTTRFFVAACALAVALTAAPRSFAQQTPPAPSAQAAPAGAPAQAPAPASPSGSSKPGFVDALNKWFDKGAADIKETFGKTGKAARDATDALTKLPGARVIEARERCNVAANGSPDCVAAAETVCKGKGFVSGKSLETQATQKCPPQVWLSGRTPTEGECPTETYVIRSVCQQ